MTLYQKSARDTIFVAITTAVSWILGVFLLPLITKTMGAENYGIWTQVSTTTSLILPFTLLGLGASLIRFLAAEKDKKNAEEKTPAETGDK